ncbi:hypothetical protein PBAL39_12127 [Pedobacter sp. BAL39]|uniref:hypothetical protein n=1 Tax=Pedobacter sp. BAL39 TaxID=391596 RepID=UPI0001559F3B|nr:hypothetical protein [Pedobacter sp. BAL39]EDM36452.1 hypothetical protein PBAL39_12127 [Pedobacter sp. BAL39]
MRPSCLKFFVFFLLIFSSVSVAFGQQDFLLKGAVIEKGSATRLESAQIVNKRNGFTVMSSNLGLFEIKASIGDTLLVMKREYSDMEVPVASNKDLVVYMAMGNTLREVRITGQSKKDELNDVKRDFKNKGSFYQGKPPLLSYIFSPLTAVYELFGRTPKNARRFGNYYNNELQQTQIDGFFNESLIKKNTGLEGKELENFMLNYRPDYEKAKNWTEYDAIKHIKDSYKTYTDTLKKK